MPLWQAATWGQSKGGKSNVKAFVYDNPPPMDAVTVPEGPEPPLNLNKQHWFEVLEVQHSVRWISVKMRSEQDESGIVLEGWVNVWKRQIIGSDHQADDTGLMVCIPKTWQAGGGGRRGIRTSSCGCQPGKLAN